MLDFHQVGLGLFTLASILSLILVVSKPIAKEFEATAIRWIRAFKRIRAELRTDEQPSPPPLPLEHTRSRRELGSGSP
jgi:hypothetical protein